MKKNTFAGNPLKTAIVTGLVLALIISWGMVFALLLFGKPEEKIVRGNSFARALREYDLLDTAKLALEGENPDLIERSLSRLQKQAGSVEELLSVLKRRRALAMVDRRYIDSYAKAAMEASGSYEYSAPLAAVAAEALALGGANSAESRALLETYSSRISQTRFDSLKLSVNVLAGNLENPARAAAMPGLLELLSTELSGFSERRDLAIDRFLLLALRGDIPSATFALNNLLPAAVPDINRMGAEFFYDHNEPLKAAELFLSLNEDAYIELASNALVLAGEVSGARNIWLALSANSQGSSTDSGAISRSLYNLASSSSNPSEQESWLEKLFLLSQNSRLGSRDNLGGFSVIRYARLLDTGRSLAVLEDYRGNPLMDLEYLRLRQADLPPTRAASEVWVLLGRHGENEDLHEWAAWYFEHQKLYSELEQLLKEVSRKGMAGSWIDLHRSLDLLKQGKTTDAEKILLAHYQDPISRGGTPQDWRIAANLGRIQEGRRSISSALDYYQSAAILVRDRPSAALVQMRLRRCLEALGRTSESLRALERAYELDPGNINIRREYNREFLR